MEDCILITGGSSGLGLELVREACRRGLCAVSISRDPAKAARLREEFGEVVSFHTGDLTDPKFIEDTVQAISRGRKIGILINCAERGVFRSPADYTPEDVEVSLQGLRGMELLTTAVLRSCGESDLKVVNILSSAALKGKPKEALYCAAKWGERGYTEALKAAYAGTSVKVVAVYPSGMDTPFWDHSRDYIPSDKSDTFLDPAEVAGMIMENILQESGKIDDEQIIRR